MDAVHQRWRSRRGRGERGTTYVEAVIGTGLITLLIFGVLEFGSLMRDHLTAASIVRGAARQGSTYGNDALADYGLLSALRTSPALSSGSIDYIVVFKATSFDTRLSSVSATCAAGTPVAGICNVYRVSDLSRPSSDFGCRVDIASPDRFWCPAGRKVGLVAGTDGPPDYVGVFIKVTHKYITHLLGTTTTVTDQSIVRIEPQRL